MPSVHRNCSLHPISKHVFHSTLKHALTHPVLILAGTGIVFLAQRRGGGIPHWIHPFFMELRSTRKQEKSFVHRPCLISSPSHIVDARRRCQHALILQYAFRYCAFCHRLNQITINRICRAMDVDFEGEPRASAAIVPSIDSLFLDLPLLVSPYKIHQ